MQIIQGNIWKAKLPVMIVIPAHSQISMSGDLVIGAGILLDVSQKLPSFPTMCGGMIKRIGYDYGFQEIQHPRTPGRAGLGLFRTRTKWQEDGSVFLIELACQFLKEYAMHNKDIPIRLAYPGIGIGLLQRDLVDPVLIKNLGQLDNVDVYYA